MSSSPTNDDEFDFDQASDLTKNRQRFMRRPKRPSNLIAQLMARKGWCQTGTANEMDEIWNEIVGEKWKNKTRVGNIARGTLEVFVENAAVNQRLGFQKKKIIAELDRRVPQNKITELKFRIGNVDPR